MRCAYISRECVLRRPVAKQSSFRFVDDPGVGVSSPIPTDALNHWQRRDELRRMKDLRFPGTSSLCARKPASRGARIFYGPPETHELEIFLMAR
jgi:hypothetical protein